MSRLPRRRIQHGIRKLALRDVSAWHIHKSPRDVELPELSGWTLVRAEGKLLHPMPGKLKEFSPDSKHWDVTLCFAGR